MVSEFIPSSAVEDDRGTCGTGSFAVCAAQDDRSITAGARHKLKRNVRKLLLLILIVIVIVVAYEWLTFPNVAPLAKEMPKTTAFMDIRREQLRDEGKDATLSYQPVPYARISPYLRRAVLVAEDNDFYEHGGVDVKAMTDALQRDWAHKRMTHGGSTITQQLAKNLYLSPSRNPLRKVKEYFLARSLENHLTKKRILELYLNVVEMGERVYGAEAASQFYFHKPASALTPNEAALLAGCLPNPRVMVPGAPNKRLRARQRMILSRLRRWGYLAEEVVEHAPPPPSPPKDITPASSTTTQTTDTTPTETTDTAATTTTTDTQPPANATPEPPTTTTQPPSDER
jgi:monofunctional biosynthetic peptidoglycan transglycosylase